MPIIKKYSVKVSEIKNPLPDLYEVTFKSNDKSFSFLPGQFLHLALDPYSPSEPWPESRCFSIRGYGDEGNGDEGNQRQLRIIFSVKGSFTRRMQNEMKVGSTVTLKMPYGDLFSRPQLMSQIHTHSSIILLAGGTGITPFLSLFSSNQFSQYLSPTLYLGVKSKSHHIYGPELLLAQQKNPSLKTKILVETDEGGAGCDFERYSYERGPLDIKNIFSNHGPNSTYFISGPPSMIKNFRGYLLEQGLDPSKIITDDWQ